MNPEFDPLDNYNIKFPESEISQEELREIEDARNSVSQLIQLFPEHSDMLGRIKAKAPDKGLATSAAHDFLDLTKMDEETRKVLHGRIRMVKTINGINQLSA